MLPGVEDDTQCDEDHGIHGVQVEVKENGGATPSGSAVPRGQTHHQPVCASITSSKGLSHESTFGLQLDAVDRHRHKVHTYVEYRAVSGVFQNIDPPPTPSPLSECVLPRTKGGWGGGDTVHYTPAGR